MREKRIEISSLLRARFKKIEISKQPKASKMTVHRAEQRLRASEPLKDRSSSIMKTSGYKPRSHQKRIRKRLMSEDDKTGTEGKKFSVHNIQDDQKEGKIKSETFQETSACSNDSEASREEHLFVE